MQVGLRDRAVVVTGAASGVGEAVARLAAEAGARLLLTDRDGDGLARVAAATGGAAHVADLLDPGAPAAIAAAARAAHGRIDGLVNAAAVTARGTLVGSDLALWDLEMTVNARAPFFLMQETVRDCLGRGAPGAIVNILSTNAWCGHPDLAIYSATKGALATLTRNTANAHMADRIRVNGINLGWTVTPSEDRLQAVALGQGPRWAEEAGRTQPLGRLLAPEEPARLALFLLSDASAPMSGGLLDLDQHVRGAP